MLRHKVYSSFALKCPRCLKGSLFVNPSLLNLKTISDMPACCAKCEQDYEIEIGFYQGAAFISYTLSCLLMFGILGISLIVLRTVPKWVVGVAILAELFLMTYILRVSRAMWLNIVVHYDKEIAKGVREG